MGSCPSYSATLNVDGSAVYEGVAYVERIGRFSGKVPFYEFGQLCLLARRVGFMGLRELYHAGWTDDATTRVIVQARSGQSKTVVDYGDFGPPELWALQRAIDGVVDAIGWAKVTEDGR